MSIENTEFRPKIVAFCCNWCSYAGADLAGSSRLVYPADVKIIRVPCSCRVNPMFILRAFEKGADGVIMCGCQKTYDTAVLHAGLYRCGKRTYTSRVGVCG